MPVGCQAPPPRAAPGSEWLPGHGDAPVGSGSDESILHVGGGVGGPERSPLLTGKALRRDAGRHVGPTGRFLPAWTRASPCLPRGSYVQ